MLKTLAKVALSLALVAGFVAAAAAEEATMTGKIMCAKCTLKKADATKCQDVLVVKTGDKTAEYYVEKNAVAEKFGHVCGGEKAAVVTGAVSDKDGKKWIAPSKMDEPKS
ncbi:MAG: DUF6370 family protein [Vicinamibacteria bacterium]